MGPRGEKEIEEGEVMNGFELRVGLASYFRDKARFMHRRSAFDGSGKSKWHADRLEEVAAYVESLDDDDPNLQEIAALGPDVAFPPEDLHTYTIHCNPSVGVSSTYARLDGDLQDFALGFWFRLWTNEALLLSEQGKPETKK